MTNRMETSHMMLLGREGMGERIYIEPSRLFIVKGDPEQNDKGSGND